MGALLQLASLGTADAYMYKDAQVTFWKQMWKKSTPFAMESVEMQATGVVNFGNKASVAIARSGDLLYKTYLQLTLPDLADYDVQPVMYSATQPALLRAYRTAPGTGMVRVQNPTNAAYNVIVLRNEADDIIGTYAVSAGGITDCAVANLTPGQAPVVKAVCYQVDDAAAFVAASFASVPDLEAAASASSTLSETRQIKNLKWCNGIGYAVLESVEWEIGGSRVDRTPNPEFLDLWQELTLPAEKEAGFRVMVGNYADWDLTDDAKSQRGEKTYYIPLLFSFTKFTTSALPLVALSFHDTRLNFVFRDFLECVKCDVPVTQLVSSDGTPLAFKDARIYCDLVHLETIERRRFAQYDHDTLIEQCTFLGDAVLSPQDVGTVRKIPLDGFNHPIKALIFVYQSLTNTARNAVTGNDIFNYDTASGQDPLEDIRLVLNGQERFSPRPMSYFYQVQPYQHCTRVPRKKVCVYSFAIDPESNAPTGSCNWSRLDSSALHVRVTSSLDSGGGRLKVYGLAWNILRIGQGQAGLAFAG